MTAQLDRCGRVSCLAWSLGFGKYSYSCALVIVGLRGREVKEKIVLVAYWRR